MAFAPALVPIFEAVGAAASAFSAVRSLTAKKPKAPELQTPGANVATPKAATGAKRRQATKAAASGIQKQTLITGAPLGQTGAGETTKRKTILGG